MVKIACHGDTFSKIFELETNSVKVNNCSKKIRNREKGKAKN